ncbi:Hint domain-containing protein [Thioclava sp. FR2]|uniref:Hint domain-containing protein n=1 Tax=Thioclava sp. FR2 TaxID=3445780 RepID=UPI003EBD220F
MPVFALYNLNDTTSEALDSATGDGAQNGFYFNGAVSNGDQAVLDGIDDIVKIASSPVFQLNTGTLEIQFTVDPTRNVSDTETVLSRDSSGTTAGGYQIETLPDGVVQITHETPTGSETFATPTGFYAPGDELKVTYSWDFGGDGGYLQIENLTTGALYEDDVPNTLTMDMGAINQNWVIGAGQDQSPAGSLANMDDHFKGLVEYLSISDTVDNPPPPPAGDGLVEGTSGDDLIDLAYTGDPEGDMIDNLDALLPGEAPQDDIVLAGAGNDTVFSLLGDDEITAAGGDDVVYAGVGNDFATGDTGNDLIFGEDGNDSLYGGQDDDTVFGGESDDLLNGGLGNDVIDGGDGDDVAEGLDGNDTINTGAGNDLVTGGAGNDFIDTRAPGATPSPDLAFPGLYGADTDPADDQDTVSAGEGNDTIFTGDDRDVIVSGGGNDFVESGDDNDSVQGNDGNDTIQAGEGNDTVTGDLGDDVIYGGTRLDATDPTHLTDDVDPDTDNNRDLLVGGMGNDSVYGGDDDDTLSGGLGDDVLDGGIDDDMITGDAGNDAIIGGHGADSMYGGGDRDVFTAVTAGDVVEGGETGDDYDTLDLRGAGPVRVTFDPANAENGTVEFLDAGGAVVGSMTFIEIENVIVPTDGTPTANPDTLVTDEDTDPTIDVLANDTDPDGQPLVVTSATAEHGEVTLNSDGTITYSPFMHYNGPDTITYTVTDPDGNTSTTTVAVTVNPVNDAPEAIDDAASTPIDTMVTIDVLSNDLDVDGDTLTLDGTPTSPDGTVTVNPDGTINFTPNPGFVGTAVVTYTVTDGTVSDVGQVVVTVGGTGRDGVVSGTAGDDLIDATYVDPTDGDMVDAGDAILPGHSPDADSIVAGDGNDTILAGADDDTIHAGSGDDEVFGGDGSESVHGGEGNDTILTGDGQDIVFGEDGDDFIDTRGPNPLPDIDYPGLYGADTDPTNDLDTVYGGDGNDTVFTGDDADRVFGRNGNDYIDGGFDDDSLYGNSGFDTIIGSEGNDYIDGGRGNDLIFGGLDLSFPDIINIPNDGGDLRPMNNADSIVGGFGNDTIYGMDDDDTISGDQGDDLIYGGVDNDEIIGGDGSDTAYGGTGNDSVQGNGGNDELHGDAGDDTLDGGLGNDTITGDEGSDTLIGADGDDNLSGGVGNDSLDGGVNNDTLSGGEGADTLMGDWGRDLLDAGTGSAPDGEVDVVYGGQDEDTIVGAGAGDLVYGGGNGEASDQDVLDLRNSGPHRITNLVTDSDGNGFDGTVEFLDAGGNVIGTSTFTNIENIVCFTPGTMIATPRGEVAVENLRVGDKVITRDNGIQEIRWAGARQMGWHDFAANPHLRPVLVKAGSLGNGLPERDMMLSPNHRLLVANDRTALYFDEHEVLVAAKHLIGGTGVHQVDSVGTTYIHFMFDQHEVVLSNGAWTESFQPGDYSLKGLGNSQRNEIFELFPELKTEVGLEAFQAARKTLKRHEARLLVR